jgi:alkyldihydroxyacetonephosphate synthase
VSLLPRTAADASLVVDLARVVGAGAVSTLDGDRFAYARDCWPRDLMRVRSGEVPAAPAAVVWPETAEEVARVLRLLAELRIPVVPWGAGSGVAGGVRPSQGGIALDLKRMRTIRSLEPKDLRAEVEVGIIGERLERLLNERGFTLGHFPSSIVCSTLGGWLAARSAGQASTLYGKIEDMTLGLEAVTPGHIRRLTGGPRPPIGPDMNALLLGSEGTFAVITAAELRIRPLPEARVLRGLRFPSVEAGLEAIRRMLRTGIRPAVVRLYDALDTFLGRGHGVDGEEEPSEVRSADALASRAKEVLDEVSGRLFGSAGRVRTELARGLIRSTVRAVLGTPLVLNRMIEVLPEDCMLVLGFEGQPGLVAAEDNAALQIAESQGAADLGPGPGEHWLKNRYNVSFKQSKAYASGAFTDTMEVCATWDRLLPMYKAVKKAIGREAFVMAHFSHAYPEGCSIYFTFAGANPSPSEPAAALERYDRLWKGALAAVSETGGTISHHHGIGELKAEAMSREHGPGGMKLLTALKAAFDPSGIMNPGKLGIEALRARPRASEAVVKATTPALALAASPSAAPSPDPAVDHDHDHDLADLVAGELGPADDASVEVEADPVGAAAPAVETGFPKEIRAVVGERNLYTTGSRTTVRPPDESALAAVLRVAHARSIPVVTDQTGFRAPPRAVQIDLSRFEGISRLSTHSLFVEVEAGVKVERLEAMLYRHGLTLGAVHPRAGSRGVGAALARNLLIRRGTAHGDLRDLCFGVRALLANGAPIETRPVPRSATGPELDRALIGGEGRFGVITRATLRVAVAPSIREQVAMSFPALEPALECARVALQRGLRSAAGRVLSNGTLAFELVAPTDEIIKAELAVFSGAARALEGRPVDASGLALGGRFDAVVEVEVRWSHARAVLEVMKAAAGGEAWIDFLAPEGVTVVARVLDRPSRQAALRAAEAAGAQVIAGRGPGAPDPAYGDIAQRISAALDPAGVFRGRVRTTES